MKIVLRVLGYAISLAVIVGSVFAVLHRQEILDWYTLRDYVPSSEIKELADNTKMSDYGRKLFYVHDPQLEDKEEFNQSCTLSEQTIVLGCYISNQSIHIYDVQDERLLGIREVTAAHEMLHAAYDRLDENKRKSVDNLVLDYYQSIKDQDDRLRGIVESYEKRDPAVIGNELHSILATEIRELPEGLEEHYSNYFIDRSAVVDYAEDYEEVFTNQQDQIKLLASQIDQLESDLKIRKTEINNREAALQSEANRLNQLRSDNQIEEYNAVVPGYNQQVNSYKALIDRYNSDIGRLNELVKSHNDLAVQQKVLFDAIDSRGTAL